MNSRKIMLVVGAALLAAAVFMPVAWYASLPFRADLAVPPVSGITLLRLAFAAQAGLLFLLAAMGWRYRRRPDAVDAPIAPDDASPDPRTAAWLLAAITILGMGLRLYRVNSDLWLDEISPLVGFGRGSVLEILGVFSRSGNHLLNTLLVKLCVALFGETEWAARLPAVAFGVATIPALYWVARSALSRYASLASALLLAVSYHHIFFSQSARGYSAYMLFSIVSTGFFVRALENDRWRSWSLFVLCSVLNAASLILSGFVIAGHFLTGVAATIDPVRRGAGRALIGRLLMVFLVIGLLAFSLYALIIPQAYAGFSAPYKTATSGFSPLRGEFLAEVVRGVAAGFGPLVLVGALPFLVIAAVGFGVLLRRRWTLALALASPLVITFVVFVARQMTLRPRFFLLAVPVTMLCFVQGVWTLADLVAKRFGAPGRTAARLKAATLASLAAVSLLSLVTYYRIPKQSYRAAIAFLEEVRAPGDVVIVYGNAELGFRFYGARAGVGGSPDYVYLRDPALVDSLMSGRQSRPTYLVFTLARDIRLSQPAFAERLRRDWRMVRVFPATVGDGAISVLRRPAAGTPP